MTRRIGVGGVCWVVGAALAALGGPAAAGDKDKAIPGVGPAGKIVKLHTKFKLADGPTADREGNVYFSDTAAQKIYKIDKDGKLSEFINKSNHANGLMISAKGELVACEMDGRIAAYDLKTKQRRVIVAEYQNRRFNAPNDLVIDKQGGIYFSDPMFRAPKLLPQGKTAVYYVDADGKVTRLIDDLPNPNGVILSPDEKTLYVIPTGQADVMAYAVEGPGKIGKGRVFCTLKQPEKSTAAFNGGDGRAIDAKGNLYVTSELGLQVFNPEGKLLGIIAFPEHPANACFGGPDLRTLYVAARTSIYTVPMAATGHRFAPPEKGKK